MLMKNIKGRKVVSGLHTIAIRLKCGDPVYYLYLFLSPGFRHYVYKVGTGLKVFGINYDKVQKYFLAVPDEKEQKYIGKILFLTDQLIAANQSKLEQLKRLKKLLMQKIFNQEWRFKGFTDPWEQRKLGEIFEERKENPKGQTLKMLSVTINSGIVDANVLNRKDNSNSNKSNYKVVHANDIAYNSMRMWQGASGVSNELGIVSPAYTVLKPRVGLDVRFWGYLFKLTKMLQEFQKNSQGLTSDTWNLKYKQIKSIEVTMPSKNEQNAISQLLQKLDFSIAANLRQRLNNLLNIDNYSRLSINA
ncbi:restriction endonuclease subunit S [Lentilactobacillus hilgardii]